MHINNGNVNKQHQTIQREVIWSPGSHPSSSIPMTGIGKIHNSITPWNKCNKPQSPGTWAGGGRNDVPLGILGLCRMTLLFVRFCQFVQGSERGRRGIIYPLTYTLCLVYKQRLYKLLRKLSVKNNNNSPRSPPVVSTFSPLENPLGPQILPGKGWEGAAGGRGAWNATLSLQSCSLLPQLDFIHGYISFTCVFLCTYNHKYIIYI